MAIIGISGRKQSGKSVSGKIIQYLTAPRVAEFTINELANFANNNLVGQALANTSNFETKQFAYKLKQIVCILIGCTMEQLEDNDFKEKELGEEWRIHRVLYDEGFGPVLVGIFNTQEEATKKCHEYVLAYQDTLILTPRKILQLMGTDCGRKIIHPNIWITSLMNEYIEEDGYKYEVQPLGGLGMSGEQKLLMKSEPEYFNNGFPNWCITDVRFPEEVKAIEDKGGIVLRIDRPIEYYMCDECMTEDILPYELKEENTCPRCGCTDEGNLTMVVPIPDTHESETALDGYPFKHRIVNDGSIEDLVEKIKDFLTVNKIIT